MQQPLYFKSNGTKLEKRSNSILAISEKEKRYFPLETVQSMRLDGAIHISAPLFNELSFRGIPIYYYTYGGKYKGMFMPPEKNTGKVRLYQYKTYFDEQKRITLAKSIVVTASKNKLTLLKRYFNKYGKQEIKQHIHNITKYLKEIDTCTDIQKLRGYEGIITKEYFSCFSYIFENYSFEGRNRQPPKDEINCLLSWYNTLLYDEVKNALFEVGVDQFCGFLHEMDDNKPAFALDVSESLRQPIVDSLLFEVVNNNMLNDHHFNKKQDLCFLSNYGKEFLFKKYEYKMTKTFLNRKTQNYISYRHAVKLDIYKFIKYFFAELEEFEGFRIF